jgi:hypothetical protein
MVHMSRTIKEALLADSSEQALRIEALLARGGLYFKGRDIAAAVLEKMVQHAPFYPPIFEKADPEGEIDGFVEYFGVTSLEELPASGLLPSHIQDVRIDTIERTSQLYPHELAFVGTTLPAVRIIFLETQTDQVG